MKLNIHFEIIKINILLSLNTYIFIQFIYLARGVYDGEWRDDKQHVLGVEVWSDNSKAKDNMKIKKDGYTLVQKWILVSI